MSFLATTDVNLWVLWIAVLAVNTALSGLFAGWETGFYLINHVRVDLQAEAGNRSAAILRKFQQNPDNILSVLLIGTNIHQYLAAFAVTAMFQLAGFTRHVEWYTLAVTTPLLFVFKDSVPKNVFQRMPELLVYGTARLIRLADVLYKLLLLSPLVRVFTSGLLLLAGRRKQAVGPYGHEGLVAVLAEGRASGALTHAQTAMAGRVMNIRDVKVSDVLIPLDQAVTISAGISRPDFLQTISLCDHSRLPVLDEEGEVVGVIDIYDVLADEKPEPPSVHRQTPLFVPADTPVTEAVYRLQRTRKSLAIATDAEGAHLGIFTMKDLLEEIVGELNAW